ncbi:serine/threonine protein kinase [Pseudofrankia sp. BMG5.37]|uniref:serine/threonine protein kinase n=1 Tax=Pseudofrankia sp. BMG5.37 TaxID=3050035 RepID=UPI0028948601|nr:serine/threonine protein kinase [Pseudofrankia sp. BMG5.37]MDT3446391.1 serine/threonine protein kinase [Pseudofrankia sp. BMG5.37]
MDDGTQGDPGKDERVPAAHDHPRNIGTGGQPPGPSVPGASGPAGYGAFLESWRRSSPAPRPRSGVPWRVWVVSIATAGFAASVTMIILVAVTTSGGSAMATNSPALITSAANRNPDRAARPGAAAAPGTEETPADLPSAPAEPGHEASPRSGGGSDAGAPPRAVGTQPPSAVLTTRAGTVAGEPPTAAPAQQAAPAQGSGSGAGSTTNAGSGAGSGSSSGSAGTTAARTTAPAASAPSAPKTNPYSAAQVCGSGYSQVDSHTLTSGSTTAKIVLMYNGSNNCVVTLKSGAGVGTAQSMSAWVQAQNGSSKVTDSGSYEYYAGPAKVSAKAICVKWGGSLGGVSWGSDWSHCG